MLFSHALPDEGQVPPQSPADIDSIHDYIARNNPAAASRVIARIRSAVLRLEQFPESGRIGGIAGAREVVVSGLPYIVVSVVTETRVDVVGVFHCAEDIERG